jgi:nucleoside phosphorylase
MTLPSRAEVARAACAELLRRLYAEDNLIKQEMLRRDCSSWADDLNDADQAWFQRGLNESLRPREARAPLEAPPAPAAPDRDPIDVLLVTVVPNEARAAELVFDIDTRGSRRKDGRRYHSVTLQTEEQRPLSVVVTSIGKSGNMNARNALSSMLSFYEPSLLVLAGTAAGRLDSVGLGDLVIPRKVWWVEKGASLTDGFKPEMDPQELQRRIFQLVGDHRVRGTNFYDTLAVNLGKLDDDEMPPGFCIDHRPAYDNDASVAASEKLLRDGSLRRLAGIDGLDRKIKLGDMESWAVVGAGGSGIVGEYTPDGAEWLVVRGVSDFGEPDKDDDWQMFAAVCAVTGARHFLETTYEPPEASRL